MRYSAIYLIRPLLILLPILFACERKEVPTVVTTEITDLTDKSAISGGQIVSDGGAPIMSSGICWATRGEPTIADSKTFDTPVDGSYTSYLSYLEPGTPYCVRAYAENSEGVGYGNTVYFSTYPTIPYVSDVTVYSVTATTAVVGGNFIFGNGLVVFMTGVCYGLSPNVGFTNSFLTTTNASDTIQINLKNLQSNTIYYVQLCVVVRLYGTTKYYAILGPESTFKTLAAKQ
jgi:hypothetical protein